MKKLINLALILSMSLFVFSCSDDDDEVTTLKTPKNLREAITGETGASEKYRIFSEKAVTDGFHNISVMFKAASEAEAIHIKNHNNVLTKMGEVSFTPTPESVQPKSTIENLRSGIDGETYEFTTMYPAFLTDAQNETNSDAIRTFTFASKAEQIHAELYALVLEALTVDGDDSNVSGIWYVCPICGNLHYSIDGVIVCEICGAGSDTFIIFE